MDGKPIIKQRHTAYEHNDVAVEQVEITLPDGTTIHDHIITTASDERVFALVNDSDKGILMLWRYNPATDLWGWELPSGVAQQRELLAHGAARICQTLTGWKPTSRPVGTTQFTFSHQLAELAHAFFFSDATWVGPGRETNSSGDCAWISLEKVPELMTNAELNDVGSQLAICHAFWIGPFQQRPSLSSPSSSP